MGQCVIMTNTYPGIDPDECTAKKEHVLTGYKAGVNGEDDPVTGTMHHLTNETTILHESGNATKVLKADERFIGNNTDGVRRMSLRYNGTPGYITANTLVGLPAQSKTVTPSTAQQNVGPDSGKLLENVVVNAIPNNRGVGAHGVSSGINAQGLYYYIPSGWYPADGSGNSWVYRTLPEVASTIGLTADKIKRGVTVSGVTGTCDWAVPFKNSYVSVPLNDYVSTSGKFERTVTVPSLTASLPYLVLWINVSFTYGSSNGETYSYCCPGNYRDFSVGMGSPCYDAKLKIGFSMLLYRTDSQIKISISDPNKSITLTRIWLQMYVATNVDINC